MASYTVKMLRRAAVICFSLATVTLTQTISPSNRTQDLNPFSTSPRFILNGTELQDVPGVRLAPLGDYADIDHHKFKSIQVEGHLANVDASNANKISSREQFSYISCDPSDYTGNLDANEVFRIVINSAKTTIIILYSRTADHCTASGLDLVPRIGGLLTTTEPRMASMLADLQLNTNSPGKVTIIPDLNSYTNSTNGHGWGNDGSALGQSRTTAVAMIVLYAITGVITALFVLIIITGAIRAHRHPERYGPRNIAGRGRQSRAKGIARAMLETLPIVKFGDHETIPKKQPESVSDIEMHPNQNTTEHDINNNPTTAIPTTTRATDSSEGDNTTTESPKPEQKDTKPTINADGRDEEGQLGCSICTEDFTKGEEVRVLPCNHKFHPDCVDPWLLNVSGTCPLCRINLQPQGSEETESDTLPNMGGSSTRPRYGYDLFPNLALPGESSTGTGNPATRRNTIINFRNIATSGTREERIAALRRMRLDRRTSQATPATEEERRGLSRRFRERFRIRTERRESIVGDVAANANGNGIGETNTTDSSNSNNNTSTDGGNTNTNTNTNNDNQRRSSVAGARRQSSATLSPTSVRAITDPIYLMRGG